MKLPGDQHKKLTDALLDAFPTKMALAQMVRQGFNENLEDVAGGNNNRDIVFDLIAWAEAREQISALVTAALEANPQNGKLKTFAAQVDITKPSVVAPPHPTGSMLPELHLSIDRQTTTNNVWRGSKPVQIEEVILCIKNIGKEMVLELIPYIKIQDEQGEFTVDVAALVQQANRVYEIPPEYVLSFPIFWLLAHTGNVINAIQLFGLGYLLERKFTLEAYCTYEVPNRIRKTETQTLEYKWSWHQPDILQDKIEIKWYGQALFRPKT